MTVQPDGELCECGKRGCLQTYASESWLIRKARLLYQSTPSTYLHQLVKNENEITLQTILNAYELGDEHHRKANLMPQSKVLLSLSPT